MTDKASRAKELLEQLAQHFFIAHRDLATAVGFDEAAITLLAAALDARAREVWIEAGNDLSHGLPLIWKKALIDRCAFKAEQCRAQAEWGQDKHGQQCADMEGT